MRKRELARLLDGKQRYVDTLETANQHLARDLAEAHAVGEIEGTQIAHAIDGVYSETAAAVYLPSDARVAVLAIALMLKNRADAMDVTEGFHVSRVLDEYERVGRYYALLGTTDEAEREAALALWEETTE